MGSKSSVDGMARVVIINVTKTQTITIQTQKPSMVIMSPIGPDLLELGITEREGRRIPGEQGKQARCQ